MTEVLVRNRQTTGRCRPAQQPLLLLLRRQLCHYCCSTLSWWCSTMTIIGTILASVAVVSSVAAAAIGSPTSSTVTTTNMNRPRRTYQIANSENYRTDFHDDEFFDVYSNPIRTLYSEVHWHHHGDILLPKHIINRFSSANEIMAVTGYEVDQVMRINNNDQGQEEEQPVPITWAYNHHYCAWLMDSRTGARLVKKTKTTSSHNNEHPPAIPHHGQEYQVEFLKKKKKNNTITIDDNTEMPYLQFFSEGNGGEMRGSYHGYPKQYAQLIQSPDTFHITPMQIDTWNRNMDNATYLPGAPMPKSSHIPNDGKAGYNGLLECPCSTRQIKEWHMTYTTTTTTTTTTSNDNNACSMDPIENATECWHAVQMVIPSDTYHNQTIAVDSSSRNHDPDDMPGAGCSARLHKDGSVDVIWRNRDSNNPTPLDDGADKDVAEDWESNRRRPPTIRRSDMQDAEEEDDDDDDDSSIDVVVGSALSDVVNVTIRVENDLVDIQMAGPADLWFGVGLGSDSMCLHMESDECPEGVYAIIVIGSSSVIERKLVYHGPGSVLPSSVEIQSNQVDDKTGMRKVHLTRSRIGAGDRYYTFESPTTATSVPIIVAKGCSMEFAQHCGHTSNVLHFLPVDRPTQICRAGIHGTIGGNKFHNDRCESSTTSDLLDQNNPTCTVQTYEGGLSCCRDGQSLLDADQDIPWPDQYLEYRLKFRFYFEEYSAAASAGSDGPTSHNSPSHQNLIRLYWPTEASAGEYDIVQCRPGVPSSQCVQVLTSRRIVRDLLHDCGLHDASGCTGKGSKDDAQTQGVQLIYAAPHCHAPSCLSTELYNADTGRLLCRVEPVYGTSDEIYDERGFLALPPCLWGSTSEGLPEPELLPLNTTLLSIKRNNNTLPHTGEMSQWQMRGVVVPRAKVSTTDRRFDDHVTMDSRPQLLRQTTKYGDKGD